MKSQVFLQFISLAILLLASTPAFAAKSYFDEDGCLTEEQYNEVLKEFRFKNLNPKLDRCKTTDVQIKVLKAISLLKNASFAPSSPSPKMTFTNDLSYIKTPYAFFKERVDTVVFQTCTELMKDAAAYVEWRSRGKMFVCVNTRAQVTTSDYINALVHEARHLDGNDLGHDTCTQGGMKGIEQACDATYKQKGAYFYGVQTHLLIAKYGQNFHPVTKYRSALNAIIDLENRFNSNSAHDLHRAVFLREKSTQTIWQLDSEFKLTRLDVKIPGQLQEMNKGYFAAYNPVTGQLHRYDIVNGDAQKDVDYKNSKYPGMEEWFIYKPVSKRPLLKSVAVEGTQFLYENKLDYALGTNDEMFFAKIGTLTLPTFKFKRIIPFSLCSTVHKKEDVLFLETEDREEYMVSLDKKLNPKIERSNYCDLDFLSGSELDGNKLGLTHDGRLLVLRFRSLVPVESAQDKRFDFISTETSVLDFLFKKAE